ncbi:MAG: hypothetical protein M3251_00875 [Thermoproteota archaeon]|nr:hypothetical protein [Thermoproteota archaeon]
MYPDNTAGARYLMGLTAAQDMNEKKKISSPTTVPDAIHPRPFRPLVCTDVKIIAIKKGL